MVSQQLNNAAYEQGKKFALIALLEDGCSIQEVWDTTNDPDWNPLQSLEHYNAFRRGVRCVLIAGRVEQEGL